MFNTIEYKEVEELNKNEYVLIDVRSPYEYSKETIPGAINIPILNDEERVHVGTIYKKECPEKARIVGMEYVGDKLGNLYKEISNHILSDKKVILFCSRGGYRSTSLVSLINSIGHKVYRLDGGYKAYRHYINEHLQIEVSKIKFITIYGNTGVGKTQVLYKLKDLGLNTLDLEGCANHRGSMLGGIGLGDQTSQKMFESLVYDELKNRNSDFVFTEGESKKIGSIFIPPYLYEKYANDSIEILLDAPIDIRVKNILDDYIDDNNIDVNKEIIKSLNYFRRYLGHELVNDYISKINDNNYIPVIKDLMINYYDPMYEYNHDKYDMVFHNLNTENVSYEILRWFENSILK